VRFGALQVTKVLSTEEVKRAIEGPGKDFGKSTVTPVKSLVTLCARINETMKQVNLVRFLVRIDKR
jgi:hypothetical protein